MNSMVTVLNTQLPSWTSQTVTRIDEKHRSRQEELKEDKKEHYDVVDIMEIEACMHELGKLTTKLVASLGGKDGKDGNRINSDVAV